MTPTTNEGRNQKGFTLIELVVVIVILGILAVTAAPKFIDLTSDAKVSIVEATEGALNSAADMAHAKALVHGVVDGDLSIAGENITFINAYPDAESIDLLMDIDSSSSDPDFNLITTPTSVGYLLIDGDIPGNCFATYIETTDKNIKPNIHSVTTHC